MPQVQRRAAAAANRAASASASPDIPPSPYNVVWLLQAAIDAPLSIQGLFFAASLPLVEQNNTALLVVKLYASLTLSLCITSLLILNLPDYLPCKRALAILSTIYHASASSIWLTTPRVVPITWGTLAESFRLYPENVLGVAHGLLVLGFTAWWQSTLGVTRMAGSGGKTA